MGLASKEGILKGMNGEDLKFFVQQLPVRRATRLSGRVVGLFAPIMEKLKSIDVSKIDLRALQVSFGKVEGVTPEANPEAVNPKMVANAWAAVGEIAPVIGAIMYALTPEQIDALQDEMFTEATLDGSPMLKVMDGKIADVAEVYKALWFALEVNFGRFFAAGRAAAAKAQANDSKGSPTT